MATRRTHVVIPEQLVKQIDALVGTRSRSKFITEAAERELVRLRQLRALDEAAGAWKDDQHPELDSGSAKWVQELRQENEQRFRKTGRG